MNFAKELSTTLNETLYLRSVCSKRSIMQRDHWLQLRFPAKVSQGDLLEQENWLLVHAPRTFWFLQKQNIRNLPYKYCVLCIPPENSHNSEPRLQHLIYWLMCRYGLLTMNANGKKI